jgi:hypothetical protein
MNIIKKSILISFVIGFLLGGTILYLFPPGLGEKELSPQQAGQKAINFVNEHITEDVTASLVGVSEESGVYKIDLKIGENKYTSYITKDGKILFSQGFAVEGQAEKTTTKSGVPQNERPDVKLFVMSYCPYGLQMEKAFLSVYQLLGDKADMGVYFVNYIMHEKKEIDENLRQYCIQKEQKEKYDEYLSCFMEAGDFESCLTKAMIDKTAMNSCIAATDQEYQITANYEDKSTWSNGRFPKFNIHSNLNEQYGVRGSPTLVINDQVVNLNSRSPEQFKEVICQAFSSPPEECSQTLSDQAFSPGFGLGQQGSSSEGSCQ